MAEVSISGQEPDHPESAEQSAAQLPQLPLKASVKRRLEREGRWYGPEGAEPVRDRLVREARASGLKKAEAQDWAYAEIDRLYPPLPEPEEGAEDDAEEADAEGDVTLPAAAAAGPGEAAAAEIPSRPREEGVSGLADLPPDWPTLPPNASLGAEIAWVQANRLRVVTGSEDRAVVDLSRALSPAPSHAAIGWLETSIRAYAKYCDIAAKATSQAEDEREHVRRERMAIEEVRGLLSEMVDGQGT